MFRNTTQAEVVVSELQRQAGSLDERLLASIAQCLVMLGKEIEMLHHEVAELREDFLFVSEHEASDGDDFRREYQKQRTV